jgi:hypothetical protein
MPSEPYVTVTLRKDVVKKLTTLNPRKATSALVTDAIEEYVSLKSPKRLRRHEIDFKLMTTASQTMLPTQTRR